MLSWPQEVLHEPTTFFLSAPGASNFLTHPSQSQENFRFLPPCHLLSCPTYLLITACFSPLTAPALAAMTDGSFVAATTDGSFMAATTDGSCRAGSCTLGASLALLIALFPSTSHCPDRQASPSPVREPSRAVLVV